MASIHPEAEQLKTALKTIPADVPVVMLNLLKFRQDAVYPDGKTGITGAQAYARYAKEAFHHVKSVGGNPIWMGKVYAGIIAPPEEKWDQVLLVRYPSMEKFMKMATDPEYLKSAEHRTAALEDSRLIAMVEDS